MLDAIVAIKLIWLIFSPMLLQSIYLTPFLVQYFILSINFFFLN